MSAPVALAVYAVLVSITGARLLPGACWAQRAPRLGILAWQAVTLSVVMSAVLAGVALALPTVPLGTSLAEMLHACALALREQYATPGGAVVSGAGVVLAVVVTGRGAYCLAADLVSARRTRRRQLQALGLIARRHRDSGALVVDHDRRAAYCLPGRGHEVVFTSAALAVLDGEQLAAVLRHERAHLHARHDLVLAVAGALRRAFPGVPVFERAVHELARLVEMDADDVAARGRDRLTLATALVSLSGGPVPVGTLGAAEEAALVRVRRLLAPAAPLGRTRCLLGVAATAVMLAAPLAMTMAPALVAAAMDYCPLTFPA